jgi:hypothetical protein
LSGETSLRRWHWNSCGERLRLGCRARGKSKRIR